MKPYRSKTACRIEIYLRKRGMTVRARHMINILLVLSVLGSVCSSAALAYSPSYSEEGESVTCTSDDYDYILLGNGTVRITDYRGQELPYRYADLTAR
ncbi:MAG: hypothetical protein K6C12_00270 [Oscillospiraceae bacterium]|nr:hypothetical protein [Oscillospiraceae bacterium]